MAVEHGESIGASRTAPPRMVGCSQKRGKKTWNGCQKGVATNEFLEGVDFE
jgi:hypothetical protein